MSTQTEEKNMELTELFVNADELIEEPLITQITDLEENRRNMLVVVVERKGPIIAGFSKRRFPYQRCECEVSDESGAINMVLFNKKISMVNEGDKIEIINAEYSQFNFERQIKIGRYTKINNRGKVKKESQMRWKDG